MVMLHVYGCFALRCFAKRQWRYGANFWDSEKGQGNTPHSYRHDLDVEMTVFSDFSL